MKIGRAFWLQILFVFVIVDAAVMLWHVLPLVDALGVIQQRVMRWGAWSAICYPILYACCNVLLLPGGVLSIGGGFFFGLWWGFLIILLGNVTGAAISLLIGRTIGRRWLQRRLEKSRRLGALQPVVEREGWKLILLSQLHPLFPTSLLNYLYGLTRLRLRTCLVWIAIGQAPGLFLYAYLGTLGQLGLRIARGQSHPHLYEYWIWGGGLVLSGLMLIILGQISMRVINSTNTQYSMSNDLNASIEAARKARSSSYSPYSKFAVGAALQTSSGKIFSGTNVENISFGLTLCAERAAVAAAIVAGERELRVLALVTDSIEPVVPCGACRQVLAEFNPSLRIVSVTLSGKQKEESLENLLPSPKRGILEHVRS